MGVSLHLTEGYNYLFWRKFLIRSQIETGLWFYQLLELETAAAYLNNQHWNTKFKKWKQKSPKTPLLFSSFVLFFCTFEQHLKICHIYFIVTVWSSHNVTLVLLLMLFWYFPIFILKRSDFLFIFIMIFKIRFQVLLWVLVLTLKFYYSHNLISEYVFLWAH